MKINKRIVFFILVVNATLVLFDIWHFFDFHETIFKNFKGVVRYSSWASYYMTLAFWGIAETVIFFGLYWVLLSFKDRKWIRTALLLMLISKIVIVLFAMFLEVRYKLTGTISIHAFEYIAGINTLLMAFTLFSFLFVRSNEIRRHYIGFSFLMTIGYLFPKVETPLYDNFGYSWLLVNQDFLMKLPFVISLILFIDVANISNRQKPDQARPDEGTSANEQVQL